MFEQTQQFTQWYIWLPLLALTIGVGGLLTKKIYLIFSQGGSAGAAIGMLVGLIVLLVVVSLLYLAKYQVRVDDNGVSVRFFPVSSLHTISFSEIKTVEIIQFSALADFGGWGVRYGKLGKAYIAKGNQGVRIEIAGGDAIVLGSQNPEDLFEAINGRRQ